MADERSTAVRRRAGLPAARPPVAATMTPKEILGVLRRHLVLMVLLTIVGLVVSGVGCFALRTYLPKYTALTYIQVLPPVDEDPMLFDRPYLHQDILYGHRLNIASLIKQQGTLEALLRRNAITKTNWFKNTPGLARRVKSLEKDLRAYAHRDADYIEVSMRCADAQEAADIVNEMVAMFVSSQGDVKRKEVSGKLTQLQEQRDTVDEELRQAEQALEDVRKAWQFSDLDKPTSNYLKNTITLKLDQLELDKSDLELAIRQLEADVKIFEDLVQGPINVQIRHAIESDPIMVSLANQLVFTEARLASLMTKFGENHRVVRRTEELRDEIKARRGIRSSEIGEQTRRANLANAKDRLTVFKERNMQLDQLREETAAKKKDLDLARVQYEQRVTIRDERIEMLNQIKQQIEKLRILHDDPETPKVRKLADAIKPLEQVVSRQLWLWLPGGVVLGFLFSVGLAFLIEIANDLVRTPRDVSKYLHIPLLGVVPDASEDREARGVELSRIVSLAPYSMLSESYRQCRTNLKLSGSGESVKTLLVTSGAPGDGKTSVAVNLATAFVAEDKKVLLIDANFRQPTSEKLFPKGQDGGFGLSSVLVGQCTAQDAIRSSGIEALDIIDAGLLPPNPAELLGSMRMADLLTEQRHNYDYVIVDSPPVLLISDAKVLAKRADATVVVVNAAATRRGAALRTIGGLQEVGANVVGCVLLGAQSLKGGYFQEQYKSYRRYQKTMQTAGATT